MMLGRSSRAASTRSMTISSATRSRMIASGSSRVRTPPLDRYPSELLTGERAENPRAPFNGLVPTNPRITRAPTCRSGPVGTG
jgi:hypothetical protein